MKRISAKFIVSVGLVIFLLGLLMLALQLRFLPNPTETKLQTRAYECETITVNAAIMANTTNSNLPAINRLLNAVVERNSECRSIGWRNQDGSILAGTDDHEKYWNEPTHNRAHTRIEVPIFTASNSQWGTAEFAYTSISRPGILGFFAHPTVRFLGFVVPLAFFVYYFYLGKMLKVMNATSVPQRVRTALNTLAGGLIVMDDQGDIVLANEAVAKWVGMNPDKLMGRQVKSLPWDKESRTSAPWAQTLLTREAKTGQTARLRSKDGDRTLILNSSPMIGHNGELRGVFLGLEDVTLLEQKEIEHKRLRKEAERANSAKSDFLARMSHEIRTPMNAILGFTDVLRRGFDTNATERSEYLNTIHSSGEHLLSLINDILDLSKVEAGRMELENRRVSPHRTILETLQVLKVTADEKNLKLTYEPADQVPETIEADPVRLRQIVTNLVGNAIKFTDHGTVRVVSSMVGDKFEFSVVDTGIGIKEEALSKIFDPFSQADSSVTRKFGGTGLGLAIAKRFSEMMGGGIRVASAPGKGTAFTVNINAGSLEGVPRLTRDEALRATSRSTETALDLQLANCRVLIVDDGVANRRLLRLFLQRAGAELMEAENGQQAIDLVNQHNFDLILMDMQMPVMDGYTASSKLREQGSSIPIVALTAHVMAEDEAKCLAAGCSHFLPKPVNTNKLLRLVGDIVGGKLSTVPTKSAPKSAPKNDTRQPEVARPKTLQPDKPIAPVTVSTNTTNVAKTSQPTSVSAAERAESQLGLRRNKAVVAEAATPALADLPPLNVSPIISTLPTDVEDFREIVVEFVETLHGKLDDMSVAAEAEQYKQLADMAHWLKGSGGTVGFAEFTEPAKELERMARAQHAPSIQPAIKHLKSIASRIYIPELAST